jgi:hypothetical protein
VKMWLMSRLTSILRILVRTSSSRQSYFYHKEYIHSMPLTVSSFFLHKDWILGGFMKVELIGLGSESLCIVETSLELF